MIKFFILCLTILAMPSAKESQDHSLDSNAVFYVRIDKNDSCSKSVSVHVEIEDSRHIEYVKIMRSAESTGPFTEQVRIEPSSAQPCTFTWVDKEQNASNTWFYCVQLIKSNRKADLNCICQESTIRRRGQNWASWNAYLYLADNIGLYQSYDTKNTEPFSTICDGCCCVEVK